jgi:diguanylate cyclase (GGDEF)-like protein
MGMPLRALIIEDSGDDAALLLQELKRGGYEPTYERLETAEALNAALDRQTWDIIFADHSMPHFSGTDALRLLKEKGIDLPFIFVSGTIGEDAAVAAIKMGANDYIIKGNLKRLITTVERELREAAGRRERKRAEETIQRMAYYDPLTDLPNRTLLYDRLHQALLAGKRNNHPVALLLMDLDRFKEINDTLEHRRGDLVLQQVGSRLRDAMWESDTVARMGGDEFAVLLSKMTATEHINVVIQKILKALEAPFAIEGLLISVEASIGVALYPDHGTNADVIIQRADVAMYAAKQTGNGYAIYAPEQDQHSPRRLALMGELRQAIEHDQLLLHYQPKINLRTKRVIGMEALVRWQHPQHGLIPPSEFIGPAERTGLIKPLTRWVLKEVHRQCDEWHHAGLNLPISVNLSVRNLQDPQLPDQVAELLRTCGVAPGWLEMEITESTIMGDPARAMETLTRLSKMGIRFSIDDFGTGYSSLGYLKRLPVHEIKIDKSFVMDMGENEDNAVIVISIINLARNLNLKVVAEGVESQEIWDRLADFGCDAAQGYYMSRPLPPAELTRWIQESPWGMKGPGKEIEGKSMA